MSDEGQLTLSQLLQLRRRRVDVLCDPRRQLGDLTLRRSLFVRLPALDRRFRRRRRGGGVRARADGLGALPELGRSVARVRHVAAERKGSWTMVRRRRERRTDGRLWLLPFERRQTLASPSLLLTLPRQTRPDRSARRKETSSLTKVCISTMLRHLGARRLHLSNQLEPLDSPSPLASSPTRRPRSRS
jgi:hypothetical protein